MLFLREVRGQRIGSSQRIAEAWVLVRISSSAELGAPIIEGWGALARLGILWGWVPMAAPWAGMERPLWGWATKNGGLGRNHVVVFLMGGLMGRMDPRGRVVLGKFGRLQRGRSSSDCGGGRGGVLGFAIDDSVSWF
jgi:hypothetical protein